MKKSVSRLLSLALAIVLTAAVLPTAALAADHLVAFKVELYNSDEIAPENYLGEGTNVPDSVTISTEKGATFSVADFTYMIIENGDLYDLIGMNVGTEFTTPTSLVIPPRPTDPAEAAAWDTLYGYVYLAYAPHQHHRLWWYSNDTHHIAYCEDCGDRVEMKWHYDRNDNGICDLCGYSIHYYTITVKDMEGGSISLSTEAPVLGERVNVTVTPAEGYVLKEIRFYNKNEEHSQLVRYEDVPGSSYHFIVLPWDIEIEADFVKAE